MRRALREIEFRPLAPKDDAFAAALARRVFAAWSNDPGRSLRGMVRGSGAIAEVACVRDERLGFFVLSTKRLARPFGPIETPVTAHLDAIAVAPRIAGRGVGSLLLSRAEQRARDVGAVVMSLMTAVSNEPAQRLFSKNGYLRTHTNFGAYANEEDAFELFKPL